MLWILLGTFQNESKSPPVSCFAKNRKKYHKSLSKKSGLECKLERNDGYANTRMGPHTIKCTHTRAPASTHTPMHTHIFMEREMMT